MSPWRRDKTWNRRGRRGQQHGRIVTTWAARFAACQPIAIPQRAARGQAGQINANCPGDRRRCRLVAAAIAAPVGASASFWSTAAGSVRNHPSGGIHQPVPGTHFRWRQARRSWSRVTESLRPRSAPGPWLRFDRVPIVAGGVSLRPHQAQRGGPSQSRRLVGEATPTSSTRDTLMTSRRPSRKARGELPSATRTTSVITGAVAATLPQRGDHRAWPAT